MKLHLNATNGVYRIQRYTKESVTINDVEYTDNLIVAPNHLSTWDVSGFSALQFVHFEKLCQLQSEMVLLGTGTQLRFPPMELLSILTSRGIGIEVMDTHAACRTYNILLAEGRQIVAALLFK